MSDDDGPKLPKVEYQPPVELPRSNPIWWPLLTDEPVQSQEPPHEPVREPDPPEARRPARDRRLGLALLPLLPAVVAAALIVVVKPPIWAIVGLVLIVGITTHLVSLMSRLKMAAMAAGGNFLRVRLVTRRLFRPKSQPEERVRITMPLAQLTHRLGELLCTMPEHTHLDLCITGLWPVYQSSDSWREHLQDLQNRLQEHFATIAFTATRWQSAHITIEVDGQAVGLLVPLELTGRFSLYVENFYGEAIAGPTRVMHGNILHQAEPLGHMTEEENG